MKLPLPSLGVVACFAFVAGCDVSPEIAPSDLQVTPLTPEGLRDLFVSECLQQRHADWVRVQHARLLNRSCWPGDHTETSCQRLDGFYEWEIPLSDGRSGLVSLEWPVGETPEDPIGPPAGLLSCRVELPMDLADPLDRAAELVAADTGRWSAGYASREHPQFRVWLAQPGHPGQLIVDTTASDENVWLRYAWGGRWFVQDTEEFEPLGTPSR